MSPTLALTEDLIRRRSVTPEDKGCQDVLIERLSAAGFQCETVVSGPDHFRVTNLWAVKRGRAGTDGKLLVFAGHTDVVPTGPWSSGAPTRSSRPTATASSMAAAPPT